MSGDFSLGGLGISTLQSLPGAFVNQVSSEIDGGITFSRARALRDRYQDGGFDLGGAILLDEVVVQWNGRHGSGRFVGPMPRGWGDAHSLLHADPMMQGIHGSGRLWHSIDGPPPTVIKGSNGFPDIAVPSYVGGGAPITPGLGVAKMSTSLVRTGTQFSKHSVQRMAQRGVTPKMAQAAINKGLKFYDPKNGSINYILENGFASGKDLLIGTNPLNGNIKTVIRGSNLMKSRMIPIY